MTDKDPKDMTVSELLRKAGNGYEGANGTVMMNLIDLMGLSRKIRHSECLYALADKIDVDKVPIIWCHYEKDYILRAQCGECEECGDDCVTTIAELERLCSEQNAKVKEADHD